MAKFGIMFALELENFDSYLTLFVRVYLLQSQKNPFLLFALFVDKKLSHPFIPLLSSAYEPPYA